MRNWKRRMATALMAVLVLPALALAAPVTINWWHAHGGALGERVNGICEGFNKSQSDYQVVPTYKGNYSDTMNAGIAAFRAKTPPHILQVFEVGTATMMAAKGAVKPVHEVMKQSGLPFDPAVYLPTVTGYYTTADGKMLSMPFNSSTPILYYNADAFKKAGLDPDKPPKTWPEVAAAAKKLVAAGVCQAGFSSAWNGWIHLENLSAWHNVAFGTKANGFGGLDAAYTFNSPLHVKHIQQLADWQREKIFVYGGRTNVGNAKFSSGEVAMYTESSAGYAGFKSTCKFEFRTSMLPYWPEHHHRRREPVGPAGPQAPRVQRGRGLLQLPLAARGAGRVAPGHGLPADHHGGLRADQETGLLRQEPRNRDRAQADDPAQTDRELQGHPLRRPRQDPRHHGQRV
ncbi:MAG: extracellular solute-binding protein [Desulfobacterales bacterium]|nr:extracellular solute-binding protein [Desulfobacterales bacterium]